MNSLWPMAVILLLPAARAQFEVASLKPNPGCENVPRSGSLSPSPGRLEMPCVTLAGLLQTAFGTFADGVSINTQPLHMEGMPAWARSEYYSLSAKADGPASTEMLAGPILQAFLEERFRLTTHRETREMPVYSMIVGKGGLKVKPLGEDGCTALDLSHPPPLLKPGLQMRATRPIPPTPTLPRPSSSPCRKSSEAFPRQEAGRLPHRRTRGKAGGQLMSGIHRSADRNRPR